MDNKDLLKVQKIGDILHAFDKDDLFENLKLKGKSALFFLIKDLKNIPSFLEFDFHSDENLQVINEKRIQIATTLPNLLLTKNMNIDLKKTVLTQYTDTYYIKDMNSKFTFEIIINYQYRKHILNPEYFARKDEVFKDLHLNCLSTLENYAIYLTSLFYGETDLNILEEIINQNKILPQQIPFIRKMICFYIGLMNKEIDKKLVLKNKALEPHLDFINQLIDFNEKENQFLQDLKNGLYHVENLFGVTMGKNIVEHPKALQIIKNRG